MGSFALVGSSNFTRPGLTSNVELNVQVSAINVGLLWDWYEHYWDTADDVTPDMLRTIERHVVPFTPFDIWSRSLAELFRHNSPPPDVWAEKHSLIYKLLDGYQHYGYAMMMERANKYGGAFLCGGVGLGKTIAGLMLLERLIEQERKTVVLLVPKSARKAVGERDLKRYLPGIWSDAAAGFGLHILQHTDLSSPKQADRIATLTRRADAIATSSSTIMQPTSSPRVRAWPGRHPRWTFRFVPTSCSWLNAVEGLFTKLTHRHCREDGVFHYVVDPQTVIDRFIKEHDHQSRPYIRRVDPNDMIAAVRRGHQTCGSIL